MVIYDWWLDFFDSQVSSVQTHTTPFYIPCMQVLQHRAGGGIDFGCGCSAIYRLAVHNVRSSRNRQRIFEVQQKVDVQELP